MKNRKQTTFDVKYKEKLITLLKEKKSKFNVLNSEPETLMLKNTWKEQAVNSKQNIPEYAQHLVFYSDSYHRSFEDIESELSYVTCIRLESKEKLIETRFQNYVVQTFEKIQSILKDKPKGNVLIQFVVSEIEGENQLLSGVTGLLKTARIENPKLICQLIETDTHADLANKLEESSKHPHEHHIRYSKSKRWIKEWKEDGNSSEKFDIPWKDGGVYLITGGAGGLGYIFSKEIIHEVKNTVLILTGRSELNDEKQNQLQELEASGHVKIEYSQVDVTDKKAVLQLIQNIRNDYRGLDGIIHSAGVIRDNFIIKKTTEELQDVLAPKVQGIVNLDKANDDLPLDFFIVFSSIAGVLGNPGQADYACANAFMDVYADYRNTLVESKQRYGKTLSVNWPLWKNGGMHVDDASEKMMMQTTGMVAMQTQTGVQALYKAMASDLSQSIVVEGDLNRIKKNLFQTKTPIAPVSEKTLPVIAQDLLFEKAENYLKKLLSSVIKLPVYRIEAEDPLEKYGIDSIMVTQLTNQLEKTFGSLSKTLFFEYQNIHELTGYFVESYRNQLTELLNIEESTSHEEVKDTLTESESKAISNRRRRFASVPNRSGEKESLDIAVIGLSGRYPKAQNIQDFWRNLRDGRDCITEIPKDRWDHSLYFDENKNKPGKTYSKWGGFIDDVDKFDPLFFNILPRDAEFMDPQERIFLECVFEAIEDAGYTRESIDQNQDFGLSGNVGVYVGVMYEEYQLYGAQQQISGLNIALSGSPSSIANRVSYYCNFQGPSLAMDTMCSSSMTAIHLACQSLKRYECEVAVAGGVNVSIHPNKYLMLGQANFVSSKGRCESFGQGGDGYVPGEGVGAVLLKPLTKAIADQDHIYGIIKGTAINHGGKTNGYTVPNPNAQASVIKRAFKDGRVNPRTLSYLEAHGTGTSLGDPIEIAGLNKVFREYTNDKQFCAIGSAKSNIGHCESAAGISGVTKVLLQLKHQQLVPSLHSETLNPNIDFNNSPFVVQQELAEWKRPKIEINGVIKEYPRIAGISSFGAGGSNAHVVIEEYDSKNQESVIRIQGIDSNKPMVFVLSAKNEERLKIYAKKMVDFLEKEGTRQSINKVDQESLYKSLQEDLISSACEIINTKEEEIDPDINLIEYGFDPVSMAVFCEQVNDSCNLNLDSAIFNDYSSIGSFARYLINTYRDNIISCYQEHLQEEYEEISENPTTLSEIVYTSQVGREAMEERLAVIVRTLKELKTKLNDFVEGEDAIDDLYRGQVKENKETLSIFAADEDMANTIDAWVAKGKYEKFLNLWVKGLAFDWNKLYGDIKPCRISLPTYPFAKERYWVPDFGTKNSVIGVSGEKPVKLHPLISSNTSDLETQKFTTYLTGEEPFLNGGVLPDMAYIEMARAAGALSGKKEVLQIRNVAWGTKIDTSKKNHEIDIHILPDQKEVRFEVNSKNDQNVIYAQGTFDYSSNTGSPINKIDIDALKTQCNIQKNGNDFYKLLGEGGVSVEPKFRAIRSLYMNENMALSELQLPEFAKDEFKDFKLNPVLMEGAVHTAGYLLYNLAGKRFFKLFNIGEIKILSEIDSQCFVSVHERNIGNKNICDIDIIDANGTIVISLKSAEFIPEDKKTIEHKSFKTISDDKLSQGIVERLIHDFSLELKLAPENIDSRAGFEEYGIDSIAITQLQDKISEQFGEISSTVFFKFKNIESLASFLVTDRREQVQAVLQLDNEEEDIPIYEEQSIQLVSIRGQKARFNKESDRQIAVIGINGRYPMAENIEKYWENLKTAKDCIIEIPEERWDYREYFDPEKGTPGKMYSKWGGFLDDVDKFDPLFFGISPIEARFMDPQERLFLQSAWSCIEDAGYTRKMLEDPSAGDQRGSIGVFVGVSFSEYQLHGLREWEQGSIIPMNSQTFSIANRVSYFLNLSGPSLSVDTACSSSLYSLHLACESIQRGECKMAIAGGVNLSLHPSKFITLSAFQFASSDGRCRSFCEGGDGYVPGEGVGAVLLKPLDEAIKDKDHIYAVVKGTATNHDGKTNGYSVPNPVAQAEVIKAALEKAKAHPSTISYVEAHGTGTSLGDPIEMTGLTDAFREHTDENKYCPVGSVKSNIGHLEAAAGIAQLTKTILQMNYKTLVPTVLHSERLNPNIDFENSPFYVQSKLTEWEQPVLNGNSISRRAGISSFGAGGVNVHVVLEEYEQDVLKISKEYYEDFILPVSAKSKKSLDENILRLKNFFDTISNEDTPALENIAYTLQTGREAMPFRAAFIVKNKMDLVAKINHYIQNHDISHDDVFQGTKNAKTSSADKKHLKSIIQNRQTRDIAKLWAEGVDIDWEMLYINEKPFRVSLPTYVFSNERYWISDLASSIPKQVKSIEVGNSNSKPSMGNDDKSKVVTDFDESSVLSQLADIPENERLEAIIEHISTQFGDALGFDRSNPPDIHQGFFDLGMTSIQAVQFMGEIEKILCVELYPTVAFDYPNISEFSEYLLSQIEFDKLEAKTDNSKYEKTVEDIYCRNVWEESNLRSTQTTTGNILIYVTDKEIARAFIQKADQVILVTPGQGFKYIGDNEYEISIENMDDHRQLMETLQQQNLFPSQIIHMTEEYEYKEQNQGHVSTEVFNSVFNICKSLMEKKIKNKIQMLHIFKNLENEFKPGQAAVSGFAKTIRLENPMFDFKVLEIRTNDIKASGLVDIALSEFDSDDIVIRYENDLRKVARLKEIGQKTSDDVSLRKKGVYIITGGAGGLGLIFAEYLAEAVKAKLVLTGRSDLGEEKKSRIRAMELSGAEVIYSKADVSRREDVEKLVKTTIDRFGEINGIIHSAGVINDAFIVNKTIEQTDAVFAPKVYGTLHLDDATKSEKLDFFMMFSSVTAITGNIGQADYSFANSFMDNFVFMREEKRTRSLCSGKTVSLNWPSWKDGGMKTNEQIEDWMEKKIGMLLIVKDDGLRAFDKALAMDSNQLIVLKGYKSRLMDHLDIKSAEIEESPESSAQTSVQRDIVSNIIDEVELEEKIEAMLQEEVEKSLIAELEELSDEILID